MPEEVTQTTTKLSSEIAAEVRERRLAQTKAVNRVKAKNEVHHICTDTGNATRLVDQFGARIRYVTEWKAWIVWDGYRWKRDTSEKIIELAKESARSILLDAVDYTGDTDVYNMITSWARQSLNRSRLYDAVKLAQPLVPVSATELDTHPHLLTFTNGTVDLRLGETGLREADPDELITKTCGYDFDSLALAPTVEWFLGWVTRNMRNGDGEVRADILAELKRLLGYTMVGTAQERVMPVLHGEGNNGKSTLMKLLQKVMGEYAESLPVETMEKLKQGRNGSAATPDKVRLQAKRFVSTLESEEGMPLSVKTLKELCSDEEFTARGLYEGMVNIRPQYTLWLATNHRPNLPATDDAAWRRLRLIPFDAFIAPEDINPKLDAELAAELPGLARMMVNEAEKWFETGLLQSVASIEATQSWREENAPLREFLEWMDDYELNAPDLPPINLGAQALHGIYNSMTGAEGWTQLSSAEFKKHLQAHGWTQKRTKTGMVWERPAARASINFKALAYTAA